MSGRDATNGGIIDHLRAAALATTGSFAICLGWDMQLVAGGKIRLVNHDLAVLDEDLYGDLVNRLLDWCGIRPARRQAKRWGGRCVR